MDNAVIEIEGMSLGKSKAPLIAQACRDMASANGGLESMLTVNNIVAHLKRRGVVVTAKTVRTWLLNESRNDRMTSFTETGFTSRLGNEALLNGERWWYLKRKTPDSVATS